MKMSRLAPAGLIVAAAVTVSASAQAVPVANRSVFGADVGAAAPALQAPAALARPAALSPDGATHAQTILSRVNELRAGLGLAPVTRYVELDAVAQEWSEQMASQRIFDHRPNFADAYPAGWRAASENIAMNGASSGSSVGDDLFEQWLNSPGHYANMTSPDANAIGIGLAYDSSTGYWYATQNFAKYEDPAAAGLTSVGPATESVPLTAAPAPSQTEGGVEESIDSQTQGPTPSTEAQADPGPQTPTPEAMDVPPAPSPTASAVTIEVTGRQTPLATATSRVPLGSTLPVTGPGLLASLVALGSAVTGFVLLRVVRRRGA